jgi:hypothetical protein
MAWAASADGGEAQAVLACRVLQKMAACVTALPPAEVPPPRSIACDMVTRSPPMVRDDGHDGKPFRRSARSFRGGTSIPATSENDRG